VKQVKVNEQVQIKLSDGSLYCNVENIKESGKSDE
jgi:exodeoxyribonuclease VII large subunit